jgi:hypothetical protein
MEGLIPSDLFLFIGSSRSLFLVSNIFKSAITVKEASFQKQEATLERRFSRYIY